MDDLVHCLLWPEPVPHDNRPQILLFAQGLKQTGKLLFDFSNGAHEVPQPSLSPVTVRLGLLQSIVIHRVDTIEQSLLLFGYFMQYFSMRLVIVPEVSHGLIDEDLQICGLCVDAAAHLINNLVDAHENNGVVQIEVFVFVDGDALGAEGEEAPGALAEVSNELAGVIGTGCLDHS